MHPRSSFAVASLAAAAVTASLLAAAAPAQACAGLSGSGTQADPWLISSDTDVPLVTMCMPTTGYFAQTADVSVTIAYVFPGTFEGDFDGRGHTVTFDGVFGVEGLFQATSGATASDVRIDGSNGSVLADGAGWLTSRDTGSTFIDIRSTGDIPIAGGGIVGAGAIGTQVGASASSGAIGTRAGGIIGSASTNVFVSGSSSSGAIADYGGGILGEGAEGATVDRSHSIGAIGMSAGGIIGASANWGTTSASLTVTNSYSTGAIDTYAGGIVGYFANGTTTSSTIALTGVFSLGAIGHAAGGIIGGEANYWGRGSTIAITNAYSLGAMTTQAGGIVGSGSNDTASTSTITVAGAYSAGSIDATAGGVVGAGASTGGVDVILSGVYTSGASPVQDNGIFAPDAGRSTVANTYAESASGSSGFNDVNFTSVVAAISPWRRGVWGSCQANSPAFLQAQFTRNPCIHSPTRSPAIIVTGDSSATYDLSADAVTPVGRNHFVMVNVIEGIPSGAAEVFAAPGLLASGSQECVDVDPCRLMNGSAVNGGTQTSFTARRTGRVSVVYGTNSLDAQSIGTFTVTARLGLRGKRDGKLVSLRGRSRGLLGIGELTVMSRRPGESRFVATGTVTPVNGTYSWTRRTAEGQQFEIYVTDGASNSNRVTL